MSFDSSKNSLLTTLNKSEVEQVLYDLFPEENRYELQLIKKDGIWFLRKRPSSYLGVDTGFKNKLFQFDLQLELFEKKEGTAIQLTWLSRTLSLFLSLSLLFVVFIILFVMTFQGKIVNPLPYFGLLIFAGGVYFFNRKAKLQEQEFRSLFYQKLLETQKE